MDQVSPVVKNLLIINILTYFVSHNLVSEAVFYTWFVAYHPMSDMFQPLQMLTYMFSHSNLQHLFFNMFALYVFAPRIEYAWGEKQFLSYFLLSGFGALLVHYAVATYQFYQNGDVMALEVPILGASGAVFGILVAFAYLYPNLELSFMFIPVPIRAKYFVLIYAAIELFSGLSSTQTGVAHFAHLGGAVSGFLLIQYWRKGGSLGRKNKF